MTGSTANRAADDRGAVPDRISTPFGPRATAEEVLGGMLTPEEDRKSVV